MAAVLDGNARAKAKARKKRRETDDPKAMRKAQPEPYANAENQISNKRRRKGQRRTKTLNGNFPLQP
jgi:hypothetical protein